MAGHMAGNATDGSAGEAANGPRWTAAMATAEAATKTMSAANVFIKRLSELLGFSEQGQQRV